MTEDNPKLAIVTIQGKEYLVPQSIVENPRARRLFIRAVKRGLETYQRLVESGVPEEEAKYVLVTPFAKYVPDSD